MLPRAPCRSGTLQATATWLPLPHLLLVHLLPTAGLLPLPAPRSHRATLVAVVDAGVVAALAVGETRVPVPAEMPMPPGDPGPGGATAEGARARTPAWKSAAARPRPALLAPALPVEASLPHRRPPRLQSSGGGLAGALLEPLPRLLRPLLLLLLVG